MKKHAGIVLILIIAVLVVISAASVITYPNEYKVIKTMGKISRVTTEPGFSLRVPVVQSETTISKARQLYDIAPTEIYTSDKKKMEVDAYIVWRVTDPVKFTQTLNASRSSAENKISAMVYGALKATVSSTSQEELIASRDAALEKGESEDGLPDLEVEDITSDELQEEEETQETDDGMKKIDENTRVISLSSKILEQLDREIEKGEEGRVAIKVNALNNLDLMEKLIECSQAGVKVELFVRGICSLRPGVPGLTDHVTVSSVVGRWLEHSRIYSFGEGEEQRLFIGSGDLLNRNLERRVEAFAEAVTPDTREQLNRVLDALRNDREKASLMQPDGTYVRAGNEAGTSSQEALYRYFSERKVSLAQPEPEVRELPEEKTSVTGTGFRAWLKKIFVKE